MNWCIHITPDQSQAILDLSQCQAGEAITFDDIVAALADEQIVVDEGVKHRIKAVLQQMEKNELPDRHPILAQATPPLAGTPGYFEWVERLDPEQRHKLSQDAASEDQASFYACSGLALVTPGETLGTFHPSVAGQPGKNVLGEEIPPDKVEEYVIEPGENVECLADGITYKSQSEGEVHLEGGKLFVSKVLNIETDIDFETGNINFVGDINIKGSIKDLFEVKVGHDLFVEGIVEGARIECSGSMSIKRGVAGKDKAVIEVEKNLSAKYISNASVWVSGDIIIDSEIVHANVNARGAITLLKGAIHGGKVTAAGNIDIPVLGSGSGVQTLVRAAINPFAELQQARFNKEKESLSKKISQLMPKARFMLKACRGKPTEELKALATEIEAANKRLVEIDAKLQAIEEESMSICKGVVIVRKHIYPGVRLEVGSAGGVVTHEMNGPLKVVAMPREGKNVLDFRSVKE